MANPNKLIPFILSWEGGFVNDPDDLGGATNKGITIGAFRTYRQKNGLSRPSVEDLRNISDLEWSDVFKTMYWDRWKADQINSQSVANILVDWVWASGKYGIEIPQKVLDVAVDGIVGPKTIKAVNSWDPKELFDTIKTERLAFIERIVKSRPANAKFRQGWINRINALKFEG